MRSLIAATLAAGLAVAVAQDVFLQGDALLREVEANCAEGCVVFNREEAAQLETAINALSAQAFEQGKAIGAQRCRL